MPKFKLFQTVKYKDEWYYAHSEIEVDKEDVEMLEKDGVGEAIPELVQVPQPKEETEEEKSEEPKEEKKKEDKGKGKKGQAK